MVGDASSHRETLPRPGMDLRPGVIEIDLADGVRLRVDAFVNEPGAAARARGIEGHAMIQVMPGTKVYLACRPVSMRYGFDGLSAQVKQVLSADPFSGHLFLFRSKRADYLKILYYDGTGLCLFAKRLESGKFVWPPIVDGGTDLSTRAAGSST